MSDNDYHQVPNPETGELIDLRRVTSFADILDKYKLNQWKMKTVAHKVATNNDIAALASMWESCEEAVTEALKWKEKANLGTAGHLASHLLDTGAAELDDFVHPDIHDMAARYQALMAQYPLSILMSERTVFNFTVGYAGHFDRIWEVVEDFELHGWKFVKGELVIGDKKTGGYLADEICLQQAAYVNAEGIYQDGDDAHFEHMPPVRKDVAIIMHVPQGHDYADLIPIRLDGAWQAFIGLAMVHEWKKVRLKIPTELRRLQERKIAGVEGTATPSAGDDAAGGEQIAPQETAPPGDVNHREALIVRIKDLRPEQLEELARRWPTDVPTFKAYDAHTAEQLAAIEVVLGGIDLGGAEENPEEGWGPQDDQSARPAAAVWVEPDGGRDLTDDEYNTIRALYMDQPDDVRSLTSAWADEAFDAGRAFSPRDKRTQRRAMILNAAVHCAKEIIDVEVVRAVIGYLMGEELQGSVTTGTAFGSLTLDEARRLTLFVGHFGKDIAVIYGDDGVLFDGPGLAAVA